MIRALLLSAALAVSASAGPISGVDPHAASATGFPGAYLGSISLSLASDPLFGSRFLDAFQSHVQSLTAMTAAPAVAAYLEQSAAGGGTLKDLRASLGREELSPNRASAILLANALARPDQFREVMDGLETMKPGMGRHASDILRDAKGTGSKQLLAALHAAGERKPRGEGLTYGPDGRWATMFDGSAASGPDGVVMSDPVQTPTSYTGYGPDGRPRSSGLLPAKR